MKIEAMDDAALGKMVKARHAALCAAHEAGLTETHPVDQWNSDSKVLRDHRAATDGSGSGLGARNLEDLDQPAMDDPGAFPGKPANPQRNGATAMDQATEEFQIRQAGLNVDAGIALARARRSNPVAVAGMKRDIDGYGRLK